MNAQSIAARIGESGCYFLSLLKLCDKQDAAIGVYRQAVQAGVLGEDCFVKDPPRLLSMIAGGKWDVRHEPSYYNTAVNELEILRFERVAAMKTYAHFVVGDGRGQVAYDPLDNSRTVDEGKLVSKRIIKRLA